MDNKHNVKYTDPLALKPYENNPRVNDYAVKKVPPPMLERAAESVSMPLTEDIAVKHDYRDIKVGENTTITIDFEDIKKRMEKDLYKALGCPFMEC